MLTNGNISNTGNIARKKKLRFNLITEKLLKISEKQSSW